MTLYACASESGGPFCVTAAMLLDDTAAGRLLKVADRETQPRVGCFALWLDARTGEYMSWRIDLIWRHVVQQSTVIMP